MNQGTNKKLLGGLPFVSRTFEGGFRDNPFVLDTDANLYVGPADQVSRDEHSAIEVIYHFLLQTGRIDSTLKELLRHRLVLLDAFASLDEARQESSTEEFRLFIFGTYDGELLTPVEDDDLPAGPCGESVNDLKARFYSLCRRLDKEFDDRVLDERYRELELSFIRTTV